jgi:hypothetical protein
MYQSTIVLHTCSLALTCLWNGMNHYLSVYMYVCAVISVYVCMCSHANVSVIGNTVVDQSLSQSRSRSRSLSLSLSRSRSLSLSLSLSLSRSRSLSLSLSLSLTLSLSLSHTFNSKECIISCVPALRTRDQSSTFTLISNFLQYLSPSLWFQTSSNICLSHLPLLGQYLSCLSFRCKFGEMVFLRTFFF